MSDYDHRNNPFDNSPFDYAPPTQRQSSGGGLLFVGGLVALFVLAIMFMAPGGSPVPTDAGAAPTVESTAPAAPVPNN